MVDDVNEPPETSAGGKPERLEEATSRYADLYDFAPVGYCTLDPEGGIQEINLTAATLLGAPRESLIGRPFSTAAPLEDTRAFRAHMERCRSESGRVTSELSLRPARYGTRNLRVVSDPVLDRDGATTAYRTVLVDVSDLKALESRLRLLSTAGETLTSSLEHAAVLEAAGRIVVPALADVCVIDVASETGVLERKVVRFADPRKQATLAERLLRFTPRPGWQTPQARVIASGEPMRLAEVSDELRDRMAHDDDHAATLRAAGFRSLMVVPLTARGRTFGALTLALAESDKSYSSLDLQVAQDLSSRIAMALDNTRLYDKARRANEGLRLAEAKASGIVSISADAIVSIDEDQRIILFNKGAETIFGYSMGEVIGAPFELLIPERFRAVHRRHVEKFSAATETSRKMGGRGASIFGVRKSGEEFPADASISRLDVGGKKVLTVVLRDVTEQARLEHDQRFLAEVGSRLATTLDYEETLTSITHLVVRALADFCMLDVVEDDGEIRRIRVAGRDPSKAWVCDALRRARIDRSRPHPIWSVLETKQPTLIEVVTPEIVASWAQSGDQLGVLRGLDPRSIMVLPLLSRGEILGVLKLVSSTGRRAYGPADLRLAAGLAERAALAIENARLYRAAERAIKTRDEVLGVVAHDLRNPLGNILLQTAILRQPELAAGRGPAWAAERIERAALHMERLIQDLMDVASLEAGRLSIERARVDARGAIAELVEAQRPLADSRSVELRIDPAPHLGEVHADRDRFLQILENLVGNAVKFTSPGGRVTVSAANRDDEVLFRVADTGAGIAADDLPHVFDRFWQARKVGRQGVGLGLPIVKGLVKAHGGRIWVESQLGVGTTFFFTLPLAPSRAVLIAEDDPDARDVLRMAIEQAGYDVAIAANGAEALEYLRHEARPQVIVLDLAMPIMDGWAFLGERNRDPDLRSIPVIVLSGERDVEDRVAAAHASFVPKPCVPAQLLEAMAHVVH
jgi:PAS domain S-box-containing protein